MGRAAGSPAGLILQKQPTNAQRWPVSQPLHRLTSVANPTSTRPPGASYATCCGQGGLALERELAALRLHEAGVLAGCHHVCICTVRRQGSSLTSADPALLLTICELFACPTGRRRSRGESGSGPGSSRRWLPSSVEKSMVAGALRPLQNRSRRPMLSVCWVMCANS